MNSLNFVATGFYGAGKTTALEVAIDKIIENSAKFSNVKIVFVTWDRSNILEQNFNEKFEKIKSKRYPHLGASINHVSMFII